MKKLEKISIIIPCHNEEEGIAKVINGIPINRLKKIGYETEIIIVDSACTDRTAEICRALGVRVIDGKKGKGNALRIGFYAVSDDTKYVVMLDGDNTYKPEEIPRLIQPLADNFCDVIIGTRLGGKMKKGALKFQNRVANWFFTFLVRQFYKANITDVLSGYFAWKKEALDALKCHLVSDGFAIEVEMVTKMVKLGLELYSVPITYDVRDGETKISSVRDGIKILASLSKNLFWSPKKCVINDVMVEDYKLNYEG
jgi:dolichol-phosphate hexosyltransferase